MTGRRDLPSFTISPWRRLMLIGGLLGAFLSWMSLSLPLTEGYVTTVRIALAVAMVVALGGALLTLAQKRRRSCGLETAQGRAGSWSLPLIGLLVVAAFVISLAPLPVRSEWLSTILTMLCLVGALGMAISLARHGTPTIFREAQKAYLDGDDRTALRHLDTLRLDRPDYYGLYHLYALICRQQGACRKALEAAESLIALRPDLYYGYAEAGLTHLADGNAQEASQYLKQAVDVAPHLPEAHLNLGMSRMETGEMEAAAQALGQALRLGLGDPVSEVIARYNLHRAYQLLGDSERAEKEWRRLQRQGRALRAWRGDLEKPDLRGAPRAKERRLLSEIERSLERDSAARP